MESEDKPKKYWQKIALSAFVAIVLGYWVNQGIDLWRLGVDESLFSIRGVAKCAPVGLHRPRLLLRMGADPNYLSPEWGWGLLHSAALFGQVELVELLLAHGADPDLEKEPSEGLRNPIGHACSTAHSPIFELLPRRRSFPFGHTIGIRSRNECPERRLAVVQTLLAHGASPDAVTEECEFFSEL